VALTSDPRIPGSDYINANYIAVRIVYLEKIIAFEKCSFFSAGL
jgi:hypothetical protein